MHTERRAEESHVVESADGNQRDSAGVVPTTREDAVFGTGLFLFALALFALLFEVLCTSFSIVNKYARTVNSHLRPIK